MPATSVGVSDLKRNFPRCLARTHTRCLSRERGQLLVRISTAERNIERPRDSREHRVGRRARGYIIISTAAGCFG